MEGASMAALALDATVTGGQIESLVQNASAKKSCADAMGTHDSVIEPKLDGWRTIWIVGADGVARFYTRSGNELTGRMPAVESQIAAAFPPGTILDAEVVAFSLDDKGNLIHKWGAVQSALSSGVAKARLLSGGLTLCVFDLICHGDVDARTVPFRGRRAALESIFDGASFDRVILVPQQPATDDAHAVHLEAGYEGSMVKWLDAPYGSGKRGAGWWKLKPQATVEVVVTGYKPGEGSFAGLVGAIEFAQYDDGTLVHRGRCSGMDYMERLDFTNNSAHYIGTVIEVAHMGVMEPTPKTPLGAFRHPQFKRTRPDRSAVSVTVHDA
jgi:DNA ligase-1